MKNLKQYSLSNNCKLLIILYLFIAVVSISVIFPISAKADLFYWPGEYHAIYNEKVALEIELKTLKRQFKNEKANLESRIKELETNIEDLKNRVNKILNKE